jgi:hypothetical protein
MMSMLCNCCVRELLILARTWFAFGLSSKTGCDKWAGRALTGEARHRARDVQRRIVDDARAALPPAFSGAG